MPDLLTVLGIFVAAAGLALLLLTFWPADPWDETEAWERARRATGGSDE